MSHADKTILVSGATGRQGGALLKYLLRDGWRIRALTRNPQGRAAQELSNSGVEVVQGDMEDLESLRRAMKGVHGVYSVQDFWTVGARREVQQGKNMADAARAGLALDTSFILPLAAPNVTLGSLIGEPNGRSRTTSASSACQSPSFGVHGELLYCNRRNRNSQRKANRSDPR